MSGEHDVLEIAVPQSLTSLMQYLQILVGRDENRIWCGGKISRAKLATFAEKMARRYPIIRNSRQRSYDRARDRAVVHLVTYARGTDVDWWLLSDKGAGGLADPSSADAHVSFDALDASHHLTVDDYVLLYATKKAPRTLIDRRSNKPRVVLKEVSTWTWKLRANVVSALKASIDSSCAELDYGHEGDDKTKPWGVRGLLALQRSRPLFSGVRNQVIDLHRYARDEWAPKRKLWLTRHPDLSRRYGDKAGALRSLDEVMKAHLPVMTRVRVFGDVPRKIRDLCAPADV